MFAAAGVDYPALLDLIIDRALFDTLGDRRPSMEVRT
jgi:hypothetical protein